MVYHLKACLQVIESVSVVCASSQLGTACCWPSTPRLLGRSWSGCVRSICCSLRLMGHFRSFAACSLTGTFIAKTSKVMGEFEVKSGSISRWHGSSQSDLDVHSYLKMYLLLKMVVFHCYVSLPEGRHGYSLQLFAVDMCWAMLVTCLRFCVPCCIGISLPLTGEAGLTCKLKKSTSNVQVYLMSSESNNSWVVVSNIFYIYPYLGR